MIGSPTGGIGVNNCDQIMTIVDAIKLWYPDMPILPPCTCSPQLLAAQRELEVSSNVVVEGQEQEQKEQQQEEGKPVQQQQPLGTKPGDAGAPHNCNFCLNGYLAQTRHFYFGHLFYQSLNALAQSDMGI